MSNLCDRNLTLGIYSRLPDEFLKVELNKTITGWFGRIFDELLMPKHRR